MQTEKRYYQDSYRKNLNARIIETKNQDNATWLLLDKTIFYPGGGGQIADKGWIGQAEVQAVEEDKGSIWHRLTQFWIQPAKSLRYVTKRQSTTAIRAGFSNDVKGQKKSLLAGSAALRIRRAYLAGTIYISRNLPGFCSAWVGTYRFHAWRIWEGRQPKVLTLQPAKRWSNTAKNALRYLLADSWR